MRNIIIISALFMTFLYLTVSAQTAKFSSYDEYYEEVNRLETEKSYDQALKLVGSVKNQFPDRQFEISQEFIYLYTKTEQFEKCFEIWEEGHRKGYFYFINTRMPRYAPFLEFERFTAIVEADAKLREEALAKSRTIYEVETPVGYSKENNYPLLIVLHGGGSSIERARKKWKSEKLGQEYILAFVQSYLHYDYKTFGWRSYDPRAREDLKRCYDEIIKAYSVDTSMLVIGGISAGGTAAFDIAFNQILPVRGLIGICTGKPDEFDSTRVRASKTAGLKVIIMGGEKDYYLPHQEEMVAVFKAVGLSYRFDVIAGMGHEYPQDFSSRLDSALKFVADSGSVN
jgi:predicted esterase